MKTIGHHLIATQEHLATLGICNTISWSKYKSTSNFEARKRTQLLGLILLKPYSICYMLWAYLSLTLLHFKTIFFAKNWKAVPNMVHRKKDRHLIIWSHVVVQQNNHANNRRLTAAFIPKLNKRCACDSSSRGSFLTSHFHYT